MKIFLTGGTGFIGSYFINRALESGHELICFRRAGSKPRIPIKNEPIWVDGSLEDDWQSEMRCCDTLVHLASHSTNVPYDSIENCLYWNLTVSLELLKMAKKSGIKKFIVTGTGFEYGQSGEEYKFIPTDAPLKPTMSYPASKAAASIIFLQWALEKKIKFQYLRIFQVFGDGEAENRLWPSLKRAAIEDKDFELTKGEQIRDFTPVEKVIDSLIESLSFSNIKNGEPIVKNIGMGHPQSLKEFSEYWWKKWRASGKLNFGKIEYRKNEVMRYVPKVKEIK